MYILSLITLTIITISTLGIITGALTFNQNANYSTESNQATNLAEAGIDKAVASLNKSAGSYNGESETALGSGTYEVTVTNLSLTDKLIKSSAYVPNKAKAKSRKVIELKISKGDGISFVYGMLVGNGGIDMGNGSTINGAIYANGNITGGNNETITGDAYVAGGVQPAADQQSDCVSPNCQDLLFGKTVSGNSQLDIAQSFTPSSTTNLNKISLKLKKIGSPPNITVRLLGDSGGKPNKNNVITSGALSPASVTSQYGFIDIGFSSTPLLQQGSLYWILMDTSSDNSNYWAWSMDSLKGYNGGSAFWSPNWQATTPQWNTINGDLGFKTWMGGVATKIAMSNGSVVNGNVHANTISGVKVSKDAYYQIITGSTVLGTSYPNSADPPPIPMPISSANITEWQSQAASYGVSSNPISGCPSTIGPGKIDANMSFGNSCTVTVKTPIWVTGNFSAGNSVILKMDSTLGSTSGVIIVDGTTTFSNGDNLVGTGATGSFLTLLSTYDSQLHGGLSAINTGNSSITGILYAPFGIINLANNANFKEAVGWRIQMGTGTTLTYDSGLISTFFSTGSSGSFSVIKGSYQSK